MQPNGWAGRMYFTANGWNFRARYWNTIGRMPTATLIYAKLILKNMQIELIFSPGVFPANHSHSQESERGKMMNATCGAKCYEQYKRLNPHGSSQKMSLVLSTLTADWYSSRCALIWKMKGTKFNRLLFQLHPKTHRTEGIDAGLLPTPISMNDGIYVDKKQVSGENIRHTKQLPTMAAMGMLPTPNTRDWKDNIGNGKDAPSIGITRGYSLGQKINSMLPTPRVFAYKDSATDRGKGNLGEVTGAGSQLNPRFVAEMMGFPPNWTELPFLSGETSQSKVMETP